jgi:hypothetical protein
VADKKEPDSQLAGEQGNALIEKVFGKEQSIGREKRSRNWEPPRTPVLREGTRFQSPCRHLIANRLSDE